uniref:Uncharacterized protein n=1 Tax=viral metagenome TaxID=1070528 RepID=A0A6M3J576_9ZZZZ
MPIQKFSMKEVDDEIGLLIAQTQQAQVNAPKQPPQLLQQLMDKAKAKRTVV